MGVLDSLDESWVSSIPESWVSSIPSIPSIAPPLDCPLDRPRSPFDESWVCSIASTPIDAA
jgi:hypothetical protein